MRTTNKKTIVLLTCLIALTLMSGCVNWEKRYKALSVEHENLKGLLERERSEKGDLADRISQDQMTIEELQRQIEEGSKSPGDVTGFGDFDVSLDPDNLEMKITGLGGKIPVSSAELFIGNAGTAARFLTAFLTLGNGEYILDGEPRMRERPIGDLVDALTYLGANIAPTSSLSPPERAGEVPRTGRGWFGVACFERVTV